MNHMAFHSGGIDFEAVYDAYYDRVFKYAYTLLLNRHDAEDVTAETFLTFLQRYQCRDPDNPGIAAYLTRVAHNRAVNLMTSFAYRKRTELPSELPDEKDFTGSLDASDLVLRLYAKLKIEERELLNMRYVMELKDREIASLLGLSEKPSTSDTKGCWRNAGNCWNKIL